MAEMRSERIVGGSRVNNTEQFPFVVSISYRYQHICGGFIYNARWIVTAASCVYGYIGYTLSDLISI